MPPRAASGPFWEDSDWARQEYGGPPLTRSLQASIERALGYELPRSYVELMRSHNGGVPRLTRHRAPSRTSWAKDHVALSGLFGVHRSTDMSLGGACGSQFWIDEWGYPPIGVYFADCPSAGHDLLCLDYRTLGADGEPRVVHVDQELGFRITPLAPTFAAFIAGLEAERD